MDEAAVFGMDEIQPTQELQRDLFHQLQRQPLPCSLEKLPNEVQIVTQGLQSRRST